MNALVEKMWVDTENLLDELTIEEEELRDKLTLRSISDAYIRKWEENAGRIRDKIDQFTKIGRKAQEL